LGCVRGERLLAEHVLAGGERLLGPRRVQGVRQRVVDRVDVWIGEYRRVIVVDLRDAPLARELLGPAAVARRDRDPLDLGVVLGRVQQRVRGDARRAERPDPEGGHRRTLASAGPRRSSRRYVYLVM